MWQVIGTSSNGTYYPIAFFRQQDEAARFVESEGKKWTAIHMEWCESVVLHGVLVDASRWKVTK